MPCRLRYQGSAKELDKLQKLLDSFCGKDAHVQDNIDIKNFVAEAAD